MTHSFGGIWTRKKLGVLERYLAFYMTALKKQSFTLHYADAFAGTGSHSPAMQADQEMLIPYEDFRGSVQAALSVEPAFHHYHFNDLNPDHIAELHQLSDSHPDKVIHIYQQDANVFVPQFCASMGRSDRAVLFLDPYSTQLDWSTLRHVAASGKVDMWMLFPLSVILRMTPRDGDKLRPEWDGTLTRLLGTQDWQPAFYKPSVEPAIDDLFGDSKDSGIQRIDAGELGHWVTGRLREIFAFVPEPMLLENNGHPLFLFYFAVSNPSRSAWGLARRAVHSIMKQK